MPEQVLISEVSLALAQAAESYEDSARRLLSQGDRDGGKASLDQAFLLRTLIAHDLLLIEVVSRLNRIRDQQL